MRYSLLGGVSFAALGLTGWVSSAHAGDIILTGHDNDYHCSVGNAGNACGALGAELNYVRAGSSLPVLVIDDGSELTSSFGDLPGSSIPFTAVTVNAVTASMFNHSKYSAFAVASVTSCGGCDNPVGSGSALAKFSTSVASFFDAGGGILGLAGATDPSAYSYVPDSAGNPTPIFSSSGFVETSTGSAIPGFFAVNGDQTHNTFANPGTSGVSSVFKVAERFGGTTAADPAVTLFASGTIKCVGASCTIGPNPTVPAVPEPYGLAVFGVGRFGLAAARRRQSLSRGRG